MIDDGLLDLIADHAAGLLAPDEARRLEQRLAADPALRAFADQVGAAQARVSATLTDPSGDLADPGADGAAAPGTRADAMPAEVAARLEAALAAAVETPGVPPQQATPAAWPGPTGPGSSGPTGGRDRAGDRSGTGPGRRTRRSWLARGALAGGGVAVAVALVIGGLIGLNHGVGVQRSTTSGAADSAKAPSLASGMSGPVIRYTTSDYTADTLPGGPDGVREPGAQNADGLEGLSRLADPAALNACLEAIVAVHPGTVTFVEYARYEGRPALIVVMTAASGSRTVVAGPDCGLAGRGDDEVFVTP